MIFEGEKETQKSSQATAKRRLAFCFVSGEASHVSAAKGKRKTAPIGWRIMRLREGDERRNSSLSIHMQMNHI